MIHDLQRDTIQKITANFQTLLADSSVNLPLITDFCRSLKNSCQVMRELRLFKGKAEEQTFCNLIIKEILECTRRRTFEILTDSQDKQSEKASKLSQLTYLSQAMMALTLIQHRFGGRLGYHCLSHTSQIVQYPDFLAVCAGANHDAVMKYASPPDFTLPSFRKVREDYHHKRTLMSNSDSNRDETHRLMHEKRKNEIKALNNLTEQKRIPGWNEGNSERESFNQMEIQLAQLVEMIVKWDEEKTNHEALALFKQQIHAEQSYRAFLIKGTIPTKADFAPAGLGDKLQTIGNVNVLPGPVELIDSPLRSRFIHLMDSAIQELLGPQAFTFKKSVDDIEDARDFYQRVVAETQNNATSDAEEIKAKVRNEMRKEKYPHSPLGEKIPQFETMDQKILKASPPFNDPMKQLKELPQEKVIACMAKWILQDAMEHQEAGLIAFLLHQIEIGIVANNDLGYFLKENVSQISLLNSIIGLIAEECPYQAQQFFIINHQLMNEGGLSQEELHLKLKDESERKKWGIGEEEYRGMLEFMDITYHFMQENLPFIQGAIHRMQLYVYNPMKALQQALKNPFFLDKITESDKKSLDKIVYEFEKVFCIEGKIRDAVLEKVEKLIGECPTAGALCHSILTAMQNQFGSHFLLAPREYGFTSENKINDQFLLEQNEKSLCL